MALSVRPAGPRPEGKRPFDVDLALARIAPAIADKPKAALFELYDEGFRSPFQQLVACIISIRTLDEVTLPVARSLLQQAGSPAAVAALPIATLDRLIRPATFHEGKARQIQAIAETIVSRHGGELPGDEATLLSFRGVGPKCANLVLGIACGQPRIGVDIHVWRVTNRWGLIHAPTPEAAIPQLEAVVPREHWVTLNRLLVPFGKHVCTRHLPHCSTCPVLDMCRQVGVDKHR
jgi:endonuclease-3